MNREEYPAKQGERHEVRRPGTSDLWKVLLRWYRLLQNLFDFQNQGAIETNTVARSEYGPKQAERNELFKPRDSNVLKGEGNFQRETSNLSDYQPNRGERYERQKPQDSDIWKVL